MKNWFVLNIKPKKEFHVERLFIEGGFTVYHPKYMQDKQIRPFFPGYAFVLFEFPDQYKMVKYTRGVKRIVGNESGPIPIDPVMIETIRTREVDGLIEFEKFGPKPEIGDEIEVVEGALKGLRGIFKKELSGRDRVVILLNCVSYQGQMIIQKERMKKVLR